MFLSNRPNLVPPEKGGHGGGLEDRKQATARPCGPGSYTTGAHRTETQRTFRCFLSVPEPIEIEKKQCFSTSLVTPPCQQVTIASH